MRCSGVSVLIVAIGEPDRPGTPRLALRIARHVPDLPARFLRAQGIVFYVDKRGTSERLGWAGREDFAVQDRPTPPMRRSP